jgi:hypothetical protein
VIKWVKEKEGILLKTNKTKAGKERHFAMAFLVQFHELSGLDYSVLGNPTVMTSEQEIR